MPDDKQQQSLLDSPDLEFGRGPERQQSFNLKTGAGAQQYARGQARQSLREKVKTTGEQSAEDIQATAKDIYGPLFEPGQTIQRNVAGYGIPYQMAGFAGMPLKQAIKTGIGGIAGSITGAYGGGHAGHYLGGIPGRLMTDKKLEAQGAGVGEAGGALLGGLAGGIGGGMAASRGGGIPLRLRVGGVPVEGELPVGGIGRAGSAGDLASWTPEDLWQGYMRNRGTAQGEALAREIQRRGLAQSPSGTYRPPTPMASSAPETDMERDIRGPARGDTLAQQVEAQKAQDAAAAEAKRQAWERQQRGGQ